MIITVLLIVIGVLGLLLLGSSLMIYKLAVRPPIVLNSDTKPVLTRGDLRQPNKFKPEENLKDTRNTHVDINEIDSITAMDAIEKYNNESGA